MVLYNMVCVLRECMGDGLFVLLMVNYVEWFLVVGRMLGGYKK